MALPQQVRPATVRQGRNTAGRVSVSCLIMGFIAFFAPFLMVAQGTMEFHERIVGGGAATSGQFPYIVSLRNLASGSHFCGGVIHTDRYVLTAAHCISGKVALSVKVVAGSILLSTGGASYSVTSITSHPNYNAYTFFNDVAILKTAGSIAFSAIAQPIAISGAFVDQNVNAVAVGWGMVALLGTSPDELQWINLLTISNSLCKSLHASSETEKITDTSLCTYMSAGQGICTGDSGGPLVYGNELVGIISWGVPCAQGKPDVYTRISSVFSWIGTIIE